MKKNLFLCLFFVICAYTASAQAGSSIAIQISIQNEYTGILESPLRYGLSTDDFQFELVNTEDKTHNLWPYYFEAWVSSPKDPELFLFKLRLRAYDIGNSFTCYVVISKPGHKLNGLSVSLDFLMKNSVTTLAGRNGIVFEINRR